MTTLTYTAYQNTESEFTQQMKTKKKLVVAHKEVYNDFNNLIKLQSLNESPQLPDKLQKPYVPSTSKIVETPYSVTEINVPVNHTAKESKNNKLCPDGKSTTYV